MVFSKYRAKAILTDPIVVAARAAIYGEYNKGAIYVECPELGFTAPNLLYCRYGLSIPFIEVTIGDYLWIEPTIDGEERWIFTGFSDCRDNITPISLDRLKIPLSAGNLSIEIGPTLKIEGSGITNTFKITAGSQSIEITAVSVKVNGSNLEVLV